MESSAKDHYIGLDHVRALAAFLVFAWHFTHGAQRTGFPVEHSYCPESLAPLAVFDEGHTGVSLFMVLSGYLFAKLLEGKTIDYVQFLRNRALRLLPLLIFVLTLVTVRGAQSGIPLEDLLLNIVLGAVFPRLPNGGWSITVEAHFYLILPLLLWLKRKSQYLPIGIVVGAVLLRFFLYERIGQIQDLAYWTIIGRIDQFVWGIVLFSFRRHLAGRHLIIAFILSAFCLFFQYFDRIGGFYHNIRYPSPDPLWIWLPSIEGITYACAIAWYDTSFQHKVTGISRVIGKLGAYSYSIYLLHWFVVFHAARWIHTRVLDLSSFPTALLAALVCFIAMLPVGWLSYRFIESPFLKKRTRYAFPAS